MNYTMYFKYMYFIEMYNETQIWNFKIWHSVCFSFKHWYIYNA